MKRILILRQLSSIAQFVNSSSSRISLQIIALGNPLRLTKSTIDLALHNVKNKV